MNEYHKFIQETYNWARYKGLCRTKAEFASLVGVCQSTISASSQERYSGKNTAKKIRAWLKQFENEYDEIPQGAPQIINEKAEMIPVFDWNVYRAEVAGRVLAGLADGHNACYAISDKERAWAVNNAISLADELIKQLKDHE